MHVLVVGGTGFIGTPVIRHLVGMGHRVTVFHRGITQGALPPEVEHLTGDRGHLTAHAERLRRLAPDAVLDMMLFDGTQATVLMETFSGYAGRIVAASSVDVYRNYGGLLGLESAPPDPVPLAEDAPLRRRLRPYRTEPPRDPEDPLAWMDTYDKIPAERCLMSDERLPGTVVRLPMVYGPGDAQHRLFAYLARMDFGRDAVLLQEDAASWRVSRGYVEDVAYAIALATTEPGAAGRIYNVGEEPADTEVDWVARLARAVGWNGRVVVLPRQELPQEIRMGEDYAYDLVADTARIRGELGYRERATRDAALRATIAWERANPPQADPSAQYAAEDRALAAL